MKVKSFEVAPSKIEVCTNSGNENLFVTALPAFEVTKYQHSDGKTHQAVEASKISPSVVDAPTNNVAGSTTTESLSQSVDPVSAKIVPSILSPAHPSPPCSESTHSSSYESVSTKRQGRNTQNRVEPPRRRGKKPASVLPRASDALTGQDPKLSHHAQSSSVDSLIGKVTTNVTETQAVEILLPSGVVNHDSKRKERATNSTQNKQQKVASKIDSAPVSSDKIPAFGRIQNVNDVARVMKEVFSGTCLPKPKAHDSIGSEDRNTPSVHITTEAAMDASSNQSLEDKACSDMATSETACHARDVAVNVHEEQLEVASNMQTLEGKPSLDAPTTGALTLTSAIQVNENKQQSDIASNKTIIIENDTLPNVSKPETICCGEVKEEAEQTQHCIENSTTRSEVEALDVTSLNAGQKTIGSSEKLTTGCGPTDLCIETSAHKICSSVVPPDPDITEHTSNDELEPSEPSSKSPSLAHGDYSGLLAQAENLSDQPQLSPSTPATDPHSRTMVVSSISERAEINSRSETESSLKASAELSLDEGIVECKISVSADHDRSNTVVLPNLSLDSSSPLLDPESWIGNHSEKVLNPSMKQCSESPSEMEGPVIPKAQKHPDALEPADLHETPMVESFSESICQERRDKGNSIHEAVVNDSPGVSEIGSLGGGTISEAAVLPPSTLVEEQTRGLEPLQNSMEKGVANCSGAQEEAKVDELETDDQMVSSTGGTHTGSSPLDELKDSKMEQGDKCMFDVGNSHGVCGGMKSSSPPLRKEVGISLSGNDCSEGHSMSLRVSPCSDDSLGKSDVPHVDQLGFVSGVPSLSQLKEEEKIGVSSDSTLVARSLSQNDMDGSNADQSNCSTRLQSGHLLPYMQGPIANPLPQEKSDCSEANMVQLKSFDSDMVDPRLTSKNMELPSSLVMEQEKVDVSSERNILCNPLAAVEAKYCLTEENQMDVNTVGIWHMISVLVWLMVNILSILFMNSFPIGLIKNYYRCRNQIL